MLIWTSHPNTHGDSMIRTSHPNTHGDSTDGLELTVYSFVPSSILSQKRSYSRDPTPTPCGRWRRSLKSTVSGLAQGSARRPPQGRGPTPQPFSHPPYRPHPLLLSHCQQRPQARLLRPGFQGKCDELVTLLSPRLTSQQPATAKSPALLCGAEELQFRGCVRSLLQAPR